MPTNCRRAEFRSGSVKTKIQLTIFVETIFIVIANGQRQAGILSFRDGETFRTISRIGCLSRFYNMRCIYGCNMCLAFWIETETDMYKLLNILFSYLRNEFYVLDE